MAVGPATTTAFMPKLDSYIAFGPTTNHTPTLSTIIIQIPHLYNNGGSTSNNLYPPLPERTAETVNSSVLHTER